MRVAISAEAFLMKPDLRFGTSDGKKIGGKPVGRHFACQASVWRFGANFGGNFWANSSEKLFQISVLFLLETSFSRRAVLEKTRTCKKAKSRALVNLLATHYVNLNFP